MTGGWCLVTEIAKRLLKPGISYFDFVIVYIAAMFLHLFKPLPNPSTQMPLCQWFVWQNLRKGVEFHI